VIDDVLCVGKYKDRGRKGKVENTTVRRRKKEVK